MCSDCWIKLDNFHKFYNQVDTARNIYLKNSVKEDIETNCDAIEYDVGISTVKVEPLDSVVAKLEEELQSESVNDTNSSSLQTPDLYDNACIDAVGTDQDDSDSNEKDNDIKNFIWENAFECDSEVEATAAEIFIEMADKTENLSLEKGKTTANKNFDHLMSKYMNTTCDVCELPFKTLTEAISHYRNQHNQRSVNIICCERQLSLRDIRYHIQYHLNPDVFKYLHRPSNRIE